MRLELGRAEAAANERAHELDRRLEDARTVMGERDALSVRAEQLGRLVDATSAELRRLQDGKAKAKAAAAALRRQLAMERQAHATAEAHAAHQYRAQLEASAMAAEVRRTPRGGRQHRYSEDESESEPSGDERWRYSEGRSEDFTRNGREGWSQPAKASLGGMPQSAYVRKASADVRSSSWRGSEMRTAMLVADASGRRSSGSLESDEGLGHQPVSTPPHRGQPVQASSYTPATDARDAEMAAQSIALAVRLKRDAQSLSATLRAGASGYDMESAIFDPVMAVEEDRELQSERTGTPPLEEPVPDEAQLTSPLPT